MTIFARLFINHWYAISQLLAALIVLAISIPLIFRSDAYAIGDCGWALTVYDMLNDGKRPTIDFAYYYGLLTLELISCYFFIFGNTPHALSLMSVLGTLLTIMATVRLTYVMKLGVAERLVLLSITGHTVTVLHASPAHIFESVMLAWSISFCAERKYILSLIFAVFAVLCKPSLGYIWILMVLFQAFISEKSWRERLLTVLIPVLVAATLCLWLCYRYGLASLITTQLPFEAAKAYRSMNMGFFFGVGRDFWLPDGANYKYYLGTLSGIYILVLVMCIIFSLQLILSRLFIINSIKFSDVAFRLSAFILHIFFVFYLFGFAWSWAYYSYVFCVVFMISLQNTFVYLHSFTRKTVFSVLIILSLISNTSTIRASIKSWSTMAYDSNTALFIENRHTESISQLEQYADTESLIIFTLTGYPKILSSKIRLLPTWYFIAPVATPFEIEQINALIQQSSLIAVPKSQAAEAMYADKAFLPYTSDFTYSHENTLFKFYKRVKTQ